MSSNNPVQNITNYVSGSHRFINIGTGSNTTTNTLVTLEKRTVMTIESCNIGIGTTLPRTTLDIIGSAYVSQNIGIGTTIIGANALNVVGNIYSSETFTATNYIGESATLSGTLITSNLMVLGTNTVNNTYIQQSSNFSVCNVVGTGPALSVSQKGIGAGYPIADFYDLDVSTTVPALRIADGGNIGIGTSIPVANLHIQGNVYSTANIGIGTTISRQALDIVGNIITTGNIGIGTTLPSALIHIGAGTTTLAPLQLTSGTNITTAIAGTIEYDGGNFYGTADTTSARGYIPNCQIFRLTQDGVYIGPGSTGFFATNSVINLAANGLYDLEANCHFLKDANTSALTCSLITSVAVKNLNVNISFNYTGTASFPYRSLSLLKSATTSNTTVGSAVTISANTSNTLNIRSLIEAGTSDSTLTINVTQTTGTLIPLQGSYYKINRIPSGNTGSFV